MNVEHEVGTLEVFHDEMGSLFCHCSVGISGENSVHIEVEIGYSPLDSVNAKRIESRIYLHRAVEKVEILVELLCHEIAHHLSFEFVTMSTGDYTHTSISFSVFNNVFSYREPLVDGQCRRYDCLYHISFNVTLI